MRMLCARCGEMVSNVTFVENGMVPGINMKRRDAVCDDCMKKPKDKWSSVEEKEEYPF